MKRSRWILVLLAALPWAAGCRFERGIGDGLEDGASSAISALLEAPVNYWIDQVFGGS